MDIRPRKPQHVDLRGESSTTRRLISLPVGIFYIWLVAVVFSQIVSAPLVVSLLAVLAGTTLQVAILINFSLRLLNSAPNDRRFSISSIFCLTVYLGVFLAAIRLAISSSASGRPDSSLSEFIGILIVGAAFIAISTVVLVSLAESLMWIAATIVNYIAERRPKR